MLVRNCQSTVGAYYSLCQGYLSGIQFGIDAADTKSGTREICFPQLPLVNPVEIFVKYVERNPSKLNQHVGHVAYAAFLEAYPCKK